MYLGRHFIGDVLGGLLVGILGVMMAHWLLRSIKTSRSAKPNFRGLLPLACFTIPFVLLAPFVPLIHSENAARLLGLLVLYGYMLKVGFPADAAKPWQRILRVIIAALLFVIIDRSMNLLMETFGWEDLWLVEMLMAFVTGSVIFVATIEISRYFGLYTWKKQ